MKLKYDNLVSDIGLKLNLRRYSLEVRETALEALVAATALPFKAVYPHRRAAAAAATAALDDPKRRVRRAASRCREVWQALDAKGGSNN